MPTQNLPLEFHIYDKETRTLICAESVEFLIMKVREHHTRSGLGSLDYEIARDRCCIEYPEECKSMPLGIVEVATGLVKSVRRWQKEGRPIVSEEVFQERQAICAKCPHQKGFPSLGIVYCELCRCGVGRVLAMKLKMPSEKCPDNPPRWNSIATSP